MDIKVQVGNYWRPVNLEIQDSRIICRFKYNKSLIEEIKNMEGARWHGFDDPPKKYWSRKDRQRNWFNLHVLMGLNPYGKYEKDFIKVDYRYPLYKHQKTMVSHILTVKSGIWAAEMGTGKTLAFIEVLRHLRESGFIRDNDDAWYIGPKGGVRAVGLEMLKWDSKIRPRMFTYDGLVKELKSWSDVRPSPLVVCFDESSKIKTPTSQRSQASLYLSNHIRENGYIIEMSGTPAPKDPTDWWHQCEVACPGFLREGHIQAFKKRLSLIEQRESLITGGVYPHLVTWFDDENKCKVCGQYKEDRKSVV